MPLKKFTCSQHVKTHNSWIVRKNFNVVIKTYPCFGVCSYDSCDWPHAISLGNEAKAGDDGGLGEGRHLSWSQLLHLPLGEVTSEPQKRFVSLCLMAAGV